MSLSIQTLWRPCVTVRLGFVNLFKTVKLSRYRPCGDSKPGRNGPDTWLLLLQIFTLCTFSHFEHFEHFHILHILHIFTCCSFHICTFCTFCTFSHFHILHIFTFCKFSHFAHIAHFAHFHIFTFCTFSSLSGCPFVSLITFLKSISYDQALRLCPWLRGLLIANKNFYLKESGNSFNQTT